MIAVDKWTIVTRQVRNHKAAKVEEHMGNLDIRLKSKNTKIP